ncbi:hypothetical protein M378DRAFT_237449 [Amanita muscaria Koide BX008]|uniref:WHIM1 domain-containing protein n=1 Tax=Amanita muscaria (strain Koide BX008) TaxID=946122 RepID=A0A0C2XB91_AMAMK|nr:hypothetical protein M378DRAFT_237449 [Amanita muscaria Koide BX008]
MAPALYTEKKGHACPTSNATHPSDRWESLFVYSFICKFTNLRGKTEGLDTPMDFENALMSREPNPILTQLLCNFILNLKPQTRNLSTDQISTTVVTVLSDYFKSSERTVFWNDDLKRNVDPFEQLEGGFFAADWRFKLIILRQLVELQLSHSPTIKELIDRAWGVVHHKHKKDAATGRLDPSDPCSQENLQLVPLGQDRNRKRYWAADDSPRVYVSTNPWKITATFQTISSTREEYLAAIEQLKNEAPGPLKKSEKRSRSDQAHLTLVEALENRIVAIDAEIAVSSYPTCMKDNYPLVVVFDFILPIYKPCVPCCSLKMIKRVQRVKRKLEQRRTLLAQAELRETRTRRKTQRPDYVYSNGIDSQDDADDYNYEEASNDYDDEDSLNSRTNGHKSKRNRDVSSLACRRSTRTATLHTNGKREGSSDSWQWGERRSTRAPRLLRV